MIKKIIKNILNKNLSPQKVNNLFLIWLLFKRLFKNKKNRSIMDVFNKKKYFVMMNSEIVFSIRDLGNSTISRGISFFSKEKETIQWIDSFNNGSNFVDIGANIGIFSLYAAYKGHNIISIEPESLNFAVLNINIYDNQFKKNIKSFPFSISTKNNIGFLKLSEIAWGKSNHQFNHKEKNDNSYLQGSYGCSADYLFEKINFIPNYIKIDVDGNELLVIQGMENTLKSGSIKSILIEINLSDQKNQEILKIFSKYDYNIISSKAVYESQPNIVNFIFEKN